MTTHKFRSPLRRGLYEIGHALPEITTRIGEWWGEYRAEVRRHAETLAIAVFLICIVFGSTIGLVAFFMWFAQ